VLIVERLPMECQAIPELTERCERSDEATTYKTIAGMSATLR
jgi:hypothetical protein